jgi:hypothetical protein
MYSFCLCAYFDGIRWKGREEVSKLTVVRTQQQTEALVALA